MTYAEQPFSSIAVIGAGTMGAGIAAQIANAGLEVLLLDLPAKPGAEKSPAEMAIFICAPPFLRLFFVLLCYCPSFVTCAVQSLFVQ